MTLKWHIHQPPSLTDVELNQQLHANADSLPGNAPIGAPMVMSAVYDEAYFWLGTVGCVSFLCFDLQREAFVAE